MKYVRTMIFILIISCIASGAVFADDVYDTYSKIIDAYNTDQDEQVVELYEELKGILDFPLNEFENNIYHHTSYLSGVSLIALDEYGEVIDLFSISEEYMVQKGYGLDLYYFWGFCHQKEGRYEEALLTYRKCLEYSKTYYDVWRKMAYVYTLMDDYEKAVAALTEGIRYLPESKELYLKRLDYHEELGNYQGMLEDYTQLIELSEYPDVYYIQRARLYFKHLGEAGLAFLDINRVMDDDTDPDLFNDWYLLRADICFALGYRAEAIADYEIVRDYNEKHGYTFQYEVYYHLAELYRETGRYYESIDHYVTAMEQDPFGAWFPDKYYHGIGLSCTRIGEYELALEYYDAILEYSENADYYLERAEIHKALGRFSAAIEDYTSCISNRESPEEMDYVGRAACKYLNGDIAGTIEDYQTALEIDPYYVGAWTDLGKIQSEAGLLEDAVQSMTNAISYMFIDEVRWSEQMFIRAQLNTQLGNYTEALEDLEVLLFYDWSIYQQYQLQGNIYEALGDYRNAAVSYRNMGDTINLYSQDPALLQLAEQAYAAADKYEAMD